MHKYYSEIMPKVLNIKQRTVIGKQILSILKHHLGDLSKMKILDFGCSNGVITNIIAGSANEVVGIDIDINALNFANKKYKRKNLRFIPSGGVKTKFKNNSFDIVIANQIYNFVEDDVKLMKEIHRLLKKGGICFFGARNKYAVIEAQYNIPFLSWLPIFTPESVRKYRTLSGLLDLVSAFTIHDYTIKILKNPAKYKYLRLKKFSWALNIFPIKFVYFFIPNYIWILEK